MRKKYAELVTELRQKAGFSQKEVADKIGISRTSYISLEQGKRDLSLSEAEKLADLFGVTVDTFSAGNVENIEKYKQMIFAFLRSDVEKDSKVTKTKLAKLLYLADFGWYYDTLESMSGMNYRKITYGPVPDTYFRVVEELFENGKLNIENKGDAMLISETEAGKQESTNLLKDSEKKLIATISKKWKGKRTQEIVAFAHNQLPYKISSENEIIPYELITQEDPGYVY